MNVLLAGMWMLVTSVGDSNVLVENCVGDRPCRGPSYNISLTISGVELGERVWISGHMDCVAGYETEGRYGRGAYFCTGEYND